MLMSPSLRPSAAFLDKPFKLFDRLLDCALCLDLTFRFGERASPTDDDRKTPDRSENADQQKTDKAEIVVQQRYSVPEPTCEIQMLACEAKHFDAADPYRCNDGHGGNDDVVVDAA